MRVGQKITFEIERSFGKLKPAHKYVGYFVGNDYVRYGQYVVKGINIQPFIKEPNKIKDFTSSEYKTFADQCFEVGIRYRDKWTSIISGKKFLEYHWDGIHAGHFIGRNNWPTRHLPMNCHAITRDENRAMAQGDARVWEKYRNFLIKTYGQHMFDEMMALKSTYIRLTPNLLQEDCKFCFNFLVEQVKDTKRAVSIMEKRFSKFPKQKSERLKELLYKISE